MRKSLILTEHITISSTILIVLLGIVLVSFSLIKDVLINPYRYFSTGLSLEEIQFFVVYTSLIVICVLISFIIYLLLTLRTRAELMILKATESLDASREQFVKICSLMGPKKIWIKQKDFFSITNQKCLLIGKKCE